MDRSELIRMFVLDAIADDYEDFAKIPTEVATLGTPCGLMIGEHEIARELTNVINMDLAKAYRLSELPSEALSVAPSLDEFDKYYYWLTLKGRAFQLAEYTGWPFDQEGRVCGDWSPPSSNHQ